MSPLEVGTVGTGNSLYFQQWEKLKSVHTFCTDGTVSEKCWKLEVLEVGRVRFLVEKASHTLALTHVTSGCNSIQVMLIYVNIAFNLFEHA